MKYKEKIWLLVLAVALLAMLPLVIDSEKSYFIYFLFLAFCYVVLAQSWNIIAGYTGQVSLGHHAFFGLGAYTTGFIWLNDITGTGYFFDPVTMILSGIVPAVLAILIGIPLLSKLRGNYFALGTLGLGEILRILFIKGGHFTGGPVGLMLPSSAYTSMKPYYYTGLLLALVTTACTYLIVKSRFGLALVAIREDESAASSNGINILKYKIASLATSAFFAGICGSLQAFYIFHVNPEGFLSFKWAIYPILMCVMGGSGTIIGPVIGAFFLTGVLTASNVYLPSVHPVFTGLMIILVMLYMPKGLVHVRLKGILSIREKIGKMWTRPRHKSINSL